jgi:hypothetical protein
VGAGECVWLAARGSGLFANCTDRSFVAGFFNIATVFLDDS